MKLILWPSDKSLIQKPPTDSAKTALMENKTKQ